MGKRGYVMVRLRRETHARLQAEVARLVDAMERGHVPDGLDNLDNPNPDALALTMNSFVAHLLDQRERHKRRVKAARAKKRVRVVSSLLPHEGRV